jgi:Protein of unknown function (DUF1385)
VFGAFWSREHLITVHLLRNLVRFLVAVQLLPALESGEETLVGGQAVLEGVMMRSPHAWAIACRKPSGEVVTMGEPLERPSEKHKWMGWPIIRGVMTLGHAMTLGYRALRFSANVAIEDAIEKEEATVAKVEAPALAVAAGSATALSSANKREKAVTISGWLAAANVIFSLAFFIFMYKYLPLLAATELKKANPALGGLYSCSSSGEFRCFRISAGFINTTEPSTKRFSPLKTASHWSRRKYKSIRLITPVAAPVF